MRCGIRHTWLGTVTAGNRRRSQPKSPGQHAYLLQVSRKLLPKAVNEISAEFPHPRRQIRHLRNFRCVRARPPGAELYRPNIYSPEQILDHRTRVSGSVQHGGRRASGRTGNTVVRRRKVSKATSMGRWSVSLVQQQSQQRCPRIPTPVQTTVTFVKPL
jgi:hypothetical protein